MKGVRVHKRPHGRPHTSSGFRCLNFHSLCGLLCPHIRPNTHRTTYNSFRD
ncbi:hypothetical protein DsansV1_C01g0007341 [Dioscorea sansibarensis]